MVNDNLTEEQQKSQLLAKARGWEVAGDMIILDNKTMTSTGIYHPMAGNLYLAPNMALAWDIHLWAHGHEKWSIRAAYASFWLHENVWRKSNAQRLWLDKIVELLEEKEDVKEIK